MKAFSQRKSLLRVMCGLLIALAGCGQTGADLRMGEPSGVVDAEFEVTQNGNPFLPLWERIPDGEPHVFSDRETGESRVYLYGSHDTTGMYCGDDYVVWSAATGDLTDWRHEGQAITTKDLEGMHYRDRKGNDAVLSVKEDHVFYAPDAAYLPERNQYVLFGFLAGAKPNNLIFTAVSDSPAGPFTDPPVSDVRL